MREYSIKRTVVIDTKLEILIKETDSILGRRGQL